MSSVILTVPLRELAHARSGDKGRTLNVAVIAYEAAAFSHLVAQLTAETFATWYGAVFDGPVTRHEVPGLGVLNFVCEGALGGGVSRNLCLDNYGKALASRVLDFPVELPARHGLQLRRPEGDPLLPYLREAGIEPAALEGTAWEVILRERLPVAERKRPGS